MRAMRARFFPVAAWAVLGVSSAHAQGVPASADAPAILAPQASSPAAREAWRLEHTDVIVDPSIRFGVLSNGLKYAIRRNATPRDTVLLRLNIDRGSLSETEEERGLSHLLEHMAFNGSEQVPEGEMVRLLERNGLAFGADTNAGTGLDAITYKLDLPRATPELLDTGLMLFRETAGNLTLASDAIDRERPVIDSERRLRDTFQLRNVIDSLAFAAPDTTLSRRLPIGDATVVATAPAGRVRALYESTYRPENATLVVVGDIDPDQVEAVVRARFADWHPAGPARGEPDPGGIDFARPLTAENWVNADIPETVSITWFKPFAPMPETVAETRAELLRTVAIGIVNRRLAKATLAADSPLVGAALARSDLVRLATSIELGAQAREGEWRPALTLIETTLRGADRFGVTQAEVDEQLAGIRTALSNAARGAATRTSGAIANEILASVRGGGEVVPTAPADDLALFEQLAPAVTSDRVTAALRAMLADRSAPLIRVTGKTAVTGGDAAIVAAFNDAHALALTAPQENTAAAFAYADWGRPGTVVADAGTNDLGIRSVRFANNVLLNIKTTDFADDQVVVDVRVDGGQLLATRQDPRIALDLARVVPLGGLEAHSADELRTILAGRAVRVPFGLDEDSFGGAATTTPRDLTLQLQVAAALIAHPGYRPEAVALLRRALPAAYDQMDATPEATIASSAEAVLSPYDPRYATPALADMLALDFDDFREAAGDSLSQGAIEIGIVGDIDAQAAIDAVAATFGTLPARRPSFEPHANGRQRAFTADRETVVLPHAGEADQAALRLYWPTTDDADLTTDLGLTLLAQIAQLQVLDELRERTGATYSPIAASVTSSDQPEFGYLVAGANLKPDAVATAKTAVLAVAKSLVDQPVDTDLLLRARAPLLEQSAKARRENGWWLNYVSQAQSRPERLDRARNAPAVLAAVSPADLQALARRYLSHPPVVIEALPAEIVKQEVRP